LREHVDRTKLLDGAIATVSVGIDSSHGDDSGAHRQFDGEA
jgi:hypothetical protein